jgi:hypothetical protein
LDTGDDFHSSNTGSGNTGSGNLDSASTSTASKGAAEQPLGRETNAPRAIKTIAVVGPSANDTAGYERCFYAGGGGCLYSHIYRGYSSFVTTPLAGVQDYVSKRNQQRQEVDPSYVAVNVTYAAGCTSRTDKTDTANIPQAVALASAADVVSAGFRRVVLWIYISGCAVDIV